MAGQDYLRAWDAIGTMLNEGKSWSGNERNVAFLNTRSERFAQASSILGIDFPSDARAVARVDWDNDGDLDLWFSNRTSPRVQYLENSWPAKAHSISLKLQGVSCNRDAIGARVEVVLADGTSTERSVRTLRAGEGYLAQSSKWLHFGLGASDAIDHVVVHWPGADSQTFRDLAADRRYLLTQGQSAVVAWETNAQSLPTSDRVAKLDAEETAVRIVPHRRLPMPRLLLNNSAGKPVELEFKSSGPTLVMLWAPWCQPCLAELHEFAQSRERLNEASLRWIVVNAEGDSNAPQESTVPPSVLLQQLGVQPDLQATASPEVVERLDVVQRSLVSAQRPLAVPASFLLAADGQLAAVYLGRVSVGQVLADAELLGKRAEPTDRFVSLPFSGQTFVNRLPADLLAIPSKLLELGDATETVDYLDRYLMPALERGENGAVSKRNVADLYARCGIQLAQQRRLDAGRVALLQATQLNPSHLQAYAALASLYQAKRETGQALATYRKMATLRPNDPTIQNNIAWILATSADADLRDPDEAIRYALQVCEMTHRRVPSALDTLAAAYAAAGRFAEAVATIQEAISVADAAGETEEAARLAKLRSLYEQERPYIEPTP